MSAVDEVRLPVRFRVREIRRLAPGEAPPEPAHAEALGPDHHHLPLRIELDPSPELDAILASLDPPEAPPRDARRRRPAPARHDHGRLPPPRRTPHRRSSAPPLPADDTGRSA